MAKINKLQYLLMNSLQKFGSVNLLLPDGMTLQIGITQTNNRGEEVKTDDYCYVVASRKDSSSVVMDSYNLAVSFPNEEDTLVYQDEYDGQATLEVI